MKNRAFFKISGEVLVGALYLPEGTEIVELATEPGEARTGVFRIYLRHHDLHEVREGNDPPQISPAFERDYETGDVRLVTWGQDEKT